MPRLQRFAILGLLTALVGCDHVTKEVAKRQLEGAAPRTIVAGVVDLRYTENTDVAFNLLRWVPEATRRPVLAIAGGVAVLALALLLFRRRGLPWGTLAVVLVSAGAIGNYLDRLTRGYVVDFVHVRHWPVFNVADIYVTVGAALLVLAMSKARTDTAAAAPEPRG
jgi:signal peptidase II